MRKRWVLASSAALVTIAATGGVVALSGATGTTTATPESPVNTATVEQGDLSAMVFQYGTLTYRGRSDGSPYSAINQARGTYTALPDDGDQVDCGEALYRVDDRPVLLLCGTVPAYRDLHSGDAGNDVRQLNQNLHALGYDVAVGVAIEPDDATFTSKTARALEALQQDQGLAVTGVLAVGAVVFLPEPVRIATVSGVVGGPAQPGAPVLSATSDTIEVQMDLDASQQGEVKVGDRARITLPGNRPATGRVDRLGRVALVPAGQNKSAGDATIPAYIRLDDPDAADGFDRAPVQVEITTAGVQDVLSVPVTALVGKSGGGLAVEVVRADGRRELVAVKPGLFDTAGGRVEVMGDLRAGDVVVVPSP